MAKAFVRFHEALRDDGRLVIVFANKSPDAWETLVSALIRAGFVVTGSWPIQTENADPSAGDVVGGARIVPSGSCAGNAPHGCAPDGSVTSSPICGRGSHSGCGTSGTRAFVVPTSCGRRRVPRWRRSAATHPVVKRADQLDDPLSVADFLRHVRRMVVGFVVSQLLSQRNGAAADLDDVTTYYLLHRNDFGLGAASAGACILYALSCNVSDADLASRYDLLTRGGRASAPASDEENAEAPQTSGSEVRLKGWSQRRGTRLGQPSADGAAPALIDCVHKVMQLWKTGEQARVNSYLSDRGLWKHELFASVVQAIIELAEPGSEERALLESMQNHLSGGSAPASFSTASATPAQGSLF